MGKFRRKYKNRKNNNQKYNGTSQVVNAVENTKSDKTNTPSTKPTNTNANNTTSVAKPTSTFTPTKNTNAGTGTGTNTGTGTTGVGKYSNYSYAKPNYNYKGKKNETMYPEFISICKPTQMELKSILANKLLEAGYTDVISGDGYVYAKGTLPVLLTAHMDTVHKVPVIDFYEYYDEEKKRHIISSPQGIGGDDRCGVYMILEIIKTHKCSVLFCEDEEIGGIGSGKFCKTEFMVDLESMKYLIELDRRDDTDAVFYDCDNPDFTKFIETHTGYKDAFGSFSDIGNLSPACKVASVNLSCGYHNAHSTSEYVVMEEMYRTIDVVKKLLNVECEQFEYIEAKYNYGSLYGYGYGTYSTKSNNNNNKNNTTTKTNRSYGSYYDDYYYDRDRYYDRYYDNGWNYDYPSKTKKKEEEKSLLVQVQDENGKINTYVSNGTTEDEAFGKFFINNSDMCFNDVLDYEWYDYKVCEDGWFVGYL